MPKKEPNSESRTHFNHLDVQLKPDGIKTVADLHSASNANPLSRIEFTARRTEQHSPVKLIPKNFFVTEKWHRPYAHALMENDPARLAPLVAEAEHAIFGRYLELSVSPAPPEYFRDLQNAIDVLIELKTSTA